MAFRKPRVKPTPYPKVAFHLIRSGQLLGATIVSTIMLYFIGGLMHDRYQLPWTFILLLTVSLLTMLALSITIVLHCRYGLNPVLNTVLNSGLAILWCTGFSLISWWSTNTLTHNCSVETWDDELGVHVCRLYKSLFAFSLIGTVATLMALAMDIHVQRNASAKGRFVPLGAVGGDDKDAGTFEERDVDALLRPEPHAVPAGLPKSQNNAQSGAGYAQAGEHYPYDAGDISYRGAHGHLLSGGEEQRRY